MFQTWKWGTYIFFAVFLAASIVWIYFFLPETKGATLEEMDRVFKSRSGETDMIMLDEARRDVAIAHDSALEVEKEMITHAEERGSSKE
jgi:hypothetical protein